MLANVLRSIGRMLGVPARAVASIVDPVAEIGKSPEIQAACRYWRQRLANAQIEKLMTMPMGTVVRHVFTDDDLARFEAAFADQLARARYYGPIDNPLFDERGLDVCLTVSQAVREAGLREKLVFTGFFTRMRIIFDREVAYEEAPYKSGDWRVVWSAAQLVEG